MISAFSHITNLMKNLRYSTHKTSQVSPIEIISSPLKSNPAPEPTITPQLLNTPNAKSEIFFTFRPRKYPQEPIHKSISHITKKVSRNVSISLSAK